MRRWIAPLLSVLLVLAMAAPAWAGMPNNLGDRELQSYVCTDTTADCGPSVRVSIVSVLNGGVGPVNLTQVGSVNTAASAALADAVANPTVGSFGAYASGFNGTTWDRLRTAAASDAATNTGYLHVEVGGAGSGGTFNRIYTIGTSGDGQNGLNLLGTGHVVYNGSTYDRARSAVNAANSTGTGIQAVGLVAQLDDTSPTTITENQFGNVRMSPARGLYVEPGPFQYSYIAAGQATTVVKGSPGFLHNVCFNSAATAANVTTIYDNASTSGTIIAIPNAVAATVPNCVTYDVTATLGIVIITTTQNGANMTVSYR